MKFGKAFGAVAALKQEGLALRHAAELARQLARFTREDERRIVCEFAFGGRERIGVAVRSEEHTSELQSLMRISYDVFCLKNKQVTTIYTRSITHTNTHRTYANLHNDTNTKLC